jgi:hypothetical protein
VKAVELATGRRPIGMREGNVVVQYIAAANRTDSRGCEPRYVELTG